MIRRFPPLIGQNLHTGERPDWVRGVIEMRECSEYVGCPCCGETMRLARLASHAELPLMETFECKPCGLAVTADAVSGTHALIEKYYFS